MHRFDVVGRQPASWCRRSHVTHEGAQPRDLGRNATRDFVDRAYECHLMVWLARRRQQRRQGRC
jgi:hypothetical protein